MKNYILLAVVCIVIGVVIGIFIGQRYQPVSFGGNGPAGRLDSFTGETCVFFDQSLSDSEAQHWYGVKVCRD